jgi:hypothetical protein
MGGNTRPSSPTPAFGPPAPTINAPQYGPTGPIAPVPPNGSTLEGPILDGPAFPQSSKDGVNGGEGFNRKRHSQRPPESGSDSDYARTRPPVAIDGPIASEKSQNPARKIGFSELPPAP